MSLYLNCSLQTTHHFVPDGLDNLGILERIHDKRFELWKFGCVMISNKLEMSFSELLEETNLVNNQDFCIDFYAQIVGMKNQFVLGMIFDTTIRVPFAYIGRIMLNSLENERIIAQIRLTSRTSFSCLDPYSFATL